MSSGVANNEEDKKPTDQGGAHINLKVKSQVREISSLQFLGFYTILKLFMMHAGFYALNLIVWKLLMVVDFDCIGFKCLYFLLILF